MKKTNYSLAFAATAALMLASCADQTDFTQADLKSQAQATQEAPISFGTYIGGSANTRAEVAKSYLKGTIGNKNDAVLGLTDLKNARFGVFGYYTGSKDYRQAVGTWGTSGTHWKANSETGAEIFPNFFYNQELWFDDATGKNAWVYAPVKYWPNGIDKANDDTNPNIDNDPSNTATEGANYTNQKLSFFAFAPFTDTPTGTYSDVASKDVKPSQITEPTWIKTNTATSGVVAMTTNESNTDVWVKYLMPDATSTEAVDLLWGLAGKNAYRETDAVNPALKIGESYNENLTKQVVPERVKFLFKHALAKMGGSTSNGDETLNNTPLKCGLKVVADVDYNSPTPKVDGQSKQGSDYFPTDFDNQYTLITLKSVKIQDGASASADNTTGVYNKGLTSTLLTRGWFDIETGKWSEEAYTFGTADAGGATYNITASYLNNDVNDATYSLNYAIKEPDAKADVDALLDATNKDKWTGDDTENKPTGVDIGTPKDVYANENVPSLLFIPTGQGTAATNQKIYVTVDYMVRTADPNLKNGYSEVEQVITNEVILNGQTLDPNKYYTLIMHLGMTSVKFEAVVTDWSNGTGDEFNEDGTITQKGEEEAEVVWLPSNVVNQNIKAEIQKISTEPANYFSNKGGVTKDLKFYYDGAEISDYTNLSFLDLPGWLTWNSTEKKLTTVDDVAPNTDDAEATITAQYVHTASDGKTTTLQQKINVVRYGTKNLKVTATPGTAAGGKMSPAANAEHIKLTVTLNGENFPVDGATSNVTVAVTTTDPAWLVWDTTSANDKFLKTAVANETGSDRSNTVTVTLTDAARGVFTTTITMTQASAKFEVTGTYSLANAAGSKSDALVAEFNGTNVTDACTVTIPAADTWLKYNSTEKKFEALSAAPAERTSSVTVSYGTSSATVTVTQAAP